jgi:hypothetical protein
MIIIDEPYLPKKQSKAAMRKFMGGILAKRKNKKADIIWVTGSPIKSININVEVKK